MQVLESARNLAEYISSLEGDFKIMNNERETAYEHIGALYTNVILQAGLNYNSVVKPRVERVIERFPAAFTLNGLVAQIKLYGIEEILKWQHHQKIERFMNLIQFSLDNRINTCNDLKLFLRTEVNRNSFISVKGVGLKTLDYTMKLLSFDTIAVDRHIISFVESAGLNHHNYNSTKQTVEFAADLLSISRSSLDATIWNYMSSENIVNHQSTQLKIQF